MACTHRIWIGATGPYSGNYCHPRYRTGPRPVTAPAPASVTDAALGRLRDAADDAFTTWEKASVERRVETWQQYEDAEIAYYRAIHIHYRENKDLTQ